MATQEPSEKLRLGKVISNTVAFIGQNLIFLLVVGALFFVLPLILINLWAVWYWPKLAYQMGAYGGGPWSIVVNVGSYLASRLLAIAANFLGLAVLSRATMDDIRGVRPSVGGCIQTVLVHSLPIVGIGFALYLAVFFASLAVLRTGLLTPSEALAAFAVLMAPFIFWGLGISVAIPVAIQEGLGVRASMSRSRALTKGYRWSIFGLFLIVMVLAFMLRLAAWVFAAIFPPAFALVSVSVVIVNAIPNAVVSTIIWTVTSVAITATYIELRRIKEGSSVEDLAEIFS